MNVILNIYVHIYIYRYIDRHTDLTDFFYKNYWHIYNHFVHVVGWKLQWAHFPHIHFGLTRDSNKQAKLDTTMTSGGSIWKHTQHTHLFFQTSVFLSLKNLHISLSRMDASPEDCSDTSHSPLNGDVRVYCVPYRFN